jgi:hypothetical protein
VRRRRAPPRAAAASGPAEEAQLVERVSALVSWCASRGASGDGLEVFPGGSGGRGRGLVASRAISAGETLLCLPLSLGIADEAEGHPASAAKALQRTPWFARLAARLLQEAALGEASAYASYLALLPPRCDASLLLCNVQLAVLRAAYPPLAALPDTTVVMVFYNEALSMLLRSVHSVLNRSPPQLLREIVLVDDGSDRAALGAPLERCVAALPKVRLVRQPRRQLQQRLQHGGRRRACAGVGAVQRQRRPYALP